MQSQMESLALKVQASRDSRNDFRYEPDRRGPSNGLGVNATVKCWTCGGGHLSRPDQCHTMRDMQGRGIMHFDSMNRMVLGTEDNPGPRLRIIPGRLNQQSFQEQYDQWKNQTAYTPMPQTSVSTVQSVVPAPVNSIAADLNGIPSGYSAPVRSVTATLIGSSPAWEKLEEDEEEFDTPLSAVNAIEGRATKRRRDQDIARTRNTQIGRFQPRVEEVVDEEVMQDGSPSESQTERQGSIEGQMQQAPRRARGPMDPEIAQRRSQLSDIVMKKIWDTEITLTIGELAGTAPKIRAGMGKGVSMDTINQRISEVLAQAQSNISIANLPRDIEDDINRIASDVSEYHASTGSPLNEGECRSKARVNFQGAHLTLPDSSPSAPREYSRDLLHVQVTVGSITVKACIDTGSSVNIIRRDVAKAMAAQMRMKPRLKLVPVDGGEFAVGACVENLPINIGDIVTESHTMVGDDCTNELLLGRLWAKDALLQTSEKRDGRVTCTVYSRDRSKYTTFEAYHPRNGGSFYEDQLWPEDFRSAHTLKAKAGM